VSSLSLNLSYDPKVLAKIQDFIHLFPEVADTIAQKTAVYGLRVILADVPVKTGMARRSFRSGRVSLGVWRIISDRGVGATYTPYLEMGTGIFGPKKRPIRAKKPGGVLAFKIFQGNTPIIANPKAAGDKKYIFFRREVKGMVAVQMVAKNKDDIRLVMGIITKQVLGRLYTMSREVPRG